MNRKPPSSLVGTQIHHPYDVAVGKHRRAAAAWWGSARTVIGWSLAVAVVVGFGVWFACRLFLADGPQPAIWVRSALSASGPYALALLTIYQVVDVLVERSQRVPEDWLSTADLIRRDIEKSLMILDAPGEVTRCTVKVWAVQRRKQSSDAAPLTKVWVDARRPAPASHVTWVVGKGVIGQAVCQQREIAAAIGERWKDVWDHDKGQWGTLGVDVTFGVTHEEFLRLRGEKAEDSPFVLAIPVRRRHAVVGVVALDAPSYMAQAVLEAEDTRHYLRVLGNLVLKGDDSSGSVSAQRHHGSTI